MFLHLQILTFENHNGRPPGKADPPPCAVHAGRYGQQAGSMHPAGMQFLFVKYLDEH